jgi:hypothetical protein
VTNTLRAALFLIDDQLSFRRMRNINNAENYTIVLRSNHKVKYHEQEKERKWSNAGG